MSSFEYLFSHLGRARKNYPIILTKLLEYRLGNVPYGSLGTFYHDFNDIEGTPDPVMDGMIAILGIVFWNTG